MSVSSAERDFLRHDNLKTARKTWDSQFQLQGEYINLKRTAFTVSTDQVEFINGQLFDTTANYAMETAASALLGYMWPDGGNTVKIEPTEAFKTNSEVVDWLNYANIVMRDMMDDPVACLDTAMPEVLEDVFSPCTGILAAWDNGKNNSDNPLLYEVIPLDQCWIWCGKGGRAIGAHWERRLSVSEIVDEYKIENVSQPIRDAFNKGRLTEKFAILICIKPREEYDANYKGAKNMPYASCHYEVETKHLLRESGFEEFPLMVVRMRRKSGEDYGRGFGFSVLPLALELNAIWESVTTYLEKKLDPALAVMDSGVLGDGTIDSSSGAINVFRVTGRAGNESPVQKLYDIGEISGTDALIETLVKAIYQYGMLDRLLDSNDDKTMTLGESQLRDIRSNRAAVSPGKRLTAELFDPLTIRTFNILYRNNKFGYVRNSTAAKLAEASGQKVRYIPDVIVRNEGKVQVYKITYFSPYARISAAEKANGIRQTFADAAGMEPMYPGISQRLDPDRALKILNVINGGGSEIMRSDPEFKTAQKALIEARAANTQLTQQDMAAGAAQKGAAAAKLAREAVKAA